METNKIFLLPGELCVEQAPTAISTLLGSCVAVCLYNKRLKFGGMNHFMLPSVRKDEAPSGKYGDYSTKQLLEKMLAIDANKNHIEASIIGGGAVTGHLGNVVGVGVSIGANNIIMARNILQEQKIAVVQKSIGSDHGRKVCFHTWNGEIQIRKIQKSVQTKEIESKKKDLSKRKIKVLVIDDSIIVRKIIADALSTDDGIEVVGCAENPYQAREMILEYDPDVLCLDIIMPRMDGLTFLKKLFLYKPKPTIIISTVAQEGSKLREQAFAIGAVDVIDKEDLNLYTGLDVVRSILTSKIRTASTTWVKKKSTQELEGL